MLQNFCEGFATIFVSIFAKVTNFQIPAIVRKNACESFVKTFAKIFVNFANALSG